jgi:hypothetical protein
MFEIEVRKGVDFRDFKALAKNRALAYRHCHRESDAWIDWKFNKSPFSPALVALVRNEESEIIACNAYGILEYKREQEVYRIAMPYETFVLDGFQGVGLFGKMLHEIGNEAKHHSIDGLLFFPNHQSLNSLRRNEHWEELKAPIRYLIKPKFSIKNLVKMPDIRMNFVSLRGNGLVRNFDFKEKFFMESNQILHLNSGAKYLDWRFNSPTQNLYRKFSGAFSEVLIREGTRGRLKEAQIVFVRRSSGCQNPAFKDELEKTISILLNEFDLIGMPISGNDEIHKTFKSMGFISLHSRTNVFFQSINGNLGAVSNDLRLSGLDFHTY